MKNIFKKLGFKIVPFWLLYLQGPERYILMQMLFLLFSEGGNTSNF